MRVVRIYHSGVVTAWRQRDRELRKRGVNLLLVSSSVWEEGSQRQPCVPGEDDFVLPIKTLGRHPNLFVYDPRALWRAIRTHKPQLLDVHEEPCSLAAAELILLRKILAPEARVLLYSAQNIPKRYPFPFRQLERLALRVASGAYVCNEAAGEILRSKGFQGDLVVLPLGVDVSSFRPRERAAPQGGLHVGYVGRITANKGIDVLVRAMVGAPEMTLEIVGSGPEEKSLRHLALNLGVVDRVAFRGSSSQESLSDIYRTFDVVAVPSLPWPGWLEQFCRVAVEAMACGVPVVASRSGALPEVVGDAGILVEPGDVAAWRSSLMSLLDDPTLWEALRKRSLDRSPSFSWEAVAEGHLDLYKAVSRASQDAKP